MSFANSPPRFRPFDLAPGRPSKYRAVRTELDGMKFDSAGEARRWAELLLEEKARKIAELRRQVRFDLLVNGESVGEYVADFTYHERMSKGDPDSHGGFFERRYVVEDFKGHRLPLYQLKKKLMKAIYGIEIRETGAPRRRAQPRTKRRA